VQCIGHARHIAWQLTTGVEHSVPAPGTQCRQISLAVTMDMAHLRKGHRHCQATVEGGDLVASHQCRMQEMTTDKLAAGDDEEFHPFILVACT
jgi:hypothetical protein